MRFWYQVETINIINEKDRFVPQLDLLLGPVQGIFLQLKYDGKYLNVIWFLAIKCMTEIAISVFLKVQILIYITPQLLKCCIKYHVLLDIIITAALQHPTIHIG